MSDLAVELEGVVKRFGGKPAVDRVDLQVPQGSMFGFIGPNGSGKTTTMRLILRIYQADEGSVRVLGETNMHSVDDRVGYLPEERGLYRRMTVGKVLRYFAKLKGIRSPNAVIKQELARLGAEDWEKKRIDQLSKGMAQKIQFLVATISKPRLVILDEPFSGLDPVNLELLRDAVLQLREQGTTVIFSTHDMGVAQNLCDHVFMIYQGKKVLDGTIDSIRQSYGGCRIKVVMAGDARSPVELPPDLPGVMEREIAGPETILHLRDESDRRSLYSRLSELGDVEHFETLRPSLHDIFVRIAKPTSDQKVNARSEELVHG